MINKKRRRLVIAVITMILLVVLSLWLFSRASEETQEISEEKEYYKSYRNNILGVAGDFCVFTYGDASVSEVTADIAVGGNFSSQTFGNYNTNWEFYKDNNLKFVNLNSYVRGKYIGGKYGWMGDKTAEELTDSLGNVKGTYSDIDINKEHGQANLYIYTGDGENTIVNPTGAHENELSNQVFINDTGYENKLHLNNQVQSYNVIGVDYEFIDFEKEFQNLSNISERLMSAGEQLYVDCISPNGEKTYTYDFPQDQDTVLLTVDPANFFNESVCDTFNINGLDATKKIVINVNCEGYLGERSPLVKVNGSATDWNFLAENIVWNYYLPEFIDETIEADQAIGTVLAPNMNVFINGNLDGAVLSRKVTANNAIYGINSNISWGDIHNPITEKTSVSGTKSWIDADNKEEKRPDSIIIKLLADGEETGKSVKLPKVITKPGNNTTPGTDNPSSNTGTDKEYYIQLDIENIMGDWWKYSNSTFNITVEYSDGISKNINLTGQQLSSWGYDANNAKVEVPAGKNAKITVDVSSNIEQYGTTVTVSENVAGLNGINGNWIVFKIASGLSNATATIENGSATPDPTPTPDPEPEEETLDWSYTFKDLPKHKTDENGVKVEIKYTIEEVEIEGYTPIITETSKGYDIANAISKEISGEKIWNDDNNRDGLRPEKIKVALYEKGKDGAEDVKVEGITNPIEVIADENNNWKYQFEDVKKYDKDGNEIEYIVKEEIDEEVKLAYTTEVEGFTIKNTHEPEKIDIKVVKKWEDNNNADSKRPEKIVVELYKGKDKIDSKELTENKWECVFEDLYKYENGKEVDYSIKEVMIDGYSSAIAHSTVENWVITNTYNPEKVSIGVEKKWNDNNNQDGNRPEEIVVKLLADDEQVDSKVITANDDWKYTFVDLYKYKDGKEIIYTVEEEKVNDYTSDITGNAEDGFIITNQYNPKKTSINVTKKWEDNDNQDGKRPKEIVIKLLADNKEVSSKTITASDNWKCEFTDLDKYKNGQEIEYTIKEVKVDNYNSTEITGNAKDGFVITNTHEVEKISVLVTKIWDDGNNKDNIRPNSITVRLYADNEEIDIKTVTEKEDWKYTFTDLPKYKAGKEIVYTIKEDVVEGYKTVIDGYKITNTHETTDKITVSGTKTWDDANNKDGIRPNSITVRLYADDEEIDSKTVTEKENWKYTFNDLPKYKDGKEIVYTIDEDAIEGYEKTVNGYDITNKHSIIDNEEFIDITVTKTWKDSGYENLRPNKVKVNLLANGEVIETKEITSADNWKYTFEKKDKYDKDSKEIVYTVTEEAVSGYETKIDGFNIINTYVPQVVQDDFLIKINKYQAGTTTKLEGAKFEIVLKDKDGKEIAKRNETTNSIGQILLKDIKISVGEYVLEIAEKQAPKGYTLSKDTIKIEFAIKEKGGKNVIEFKEKYKNAEIEELTITVKVENQKQKLPETPKKDNTTAKGKLPQTGLSSIFVLGTIIVAFIVIGAIGIIKYREIKF